MSAVQHLIEQLARYKEKYPCETAIVEMFVAFLDQNQLKSFDRQLTDGHVTASCCLLNTQQTHILLTHHRKLNSWIQLGGHADGESSPLTVAKKEAVEESGIETIDILLGGELLDIDRHVIPARSNEKQHFHYDFRFAMKAVDNDNYVVSDESLDLRWVKLEEIDTFVSDDSVLRMVSKWTMAGGVEN